MSKKYEPVTLEHAQTGRTWRAESKVQEVELLNRGWRVKSKKQPAPANKSTTAPANKSK